MNVHDAEVRKKWLLDSLAGEDAITLKVAAAIPADRYGWKPVPEKAKTAAELAMHAAGAGEFFIGIVSGTEPKEGGGPAPRNPDELLGAIRSCQARFSGFVRDLSAADCAKEHDFFGEKHAAIDLLTWHMLHLIHHRGQLATYLRVMGAKVPSIYGGSADDDPYAATK